MKTNSCTFLQAYRTFEDNHKFQQHINNLEAQWSIGNLEQPDQLRELIDTHMQTMICTKRWHVQAKKPEPVALPAESNPKSSCG